MNPFGRCSPSPAVLLTCTRRVSDPRMSVEVVKHGTTSLLLLASRAKEIPRPLGCDES